MTCETCQTPGCPCAAVVLPDDAALIAALRVCRKNLRARLEQLAESGTGYSQQTVDAIVKERDALRKESAIDADRANYYRDKWQAAEAKLERVRKMHANLLAYPDEPIGGVSASVIWTRHAFRTVAADLGDILNDKETP